jgi:hypothetical protein
MNISAEILSISDRLSFAFAKSPLFRHGVAAIMELKEGRSVVLLTVEGGFCERREFTRGAVT